MLAEADYVCRRLKIMRQRKIQESEDFLMVNCLAIMWVGVGGGAAIVHGLIDKTKCVYNLLFLPPLS